MVLIWRRAAAGLRHSRAPDLRHPFLITPRATIKRYFHFTRASPCRTINYSRMNLFDLSNEVAVVIGATGVLGGKIAEGLANAGAKIAVVGRNAERGEARVCEIKKTGGTAKFFSADAVSP